MSAGRSFRSCAGVVKGVCQAVASQASDNMIRPTMAGETKDKQGVRKAEVKALAEDGETETRK